MEERDARRNWRGLVPRAVWGPQMARLEKLGPHAERGVYNRSERQKQNQRRNGGISRMMSMSLSEGESERKLRTERRTRASARQWRPPAAPTREKGQGQ
jgi:hypothetical protein